jgi:hypothetical protein
MDGGKKAAAKALFQRKNRLQESRFQTEDKTIASKEKHVSRQSDL